MADDIGNDISTFAGQTYPQIPKDVLQDLCSRFLINIPENEKNDMVRICFQIELAHWYYIDFCRQDDPDLPGCGMKAFISIIFTEFDFLNKSKQSVQTIFDNWKKYKVRVPVFGAILLDEALEKCLLVQGFHSKTSWGFPKGKVNKDENDLDCAIREVGEEVGYDITPLAHSDQFLENTIHDHQVRLYIVAGVDEYYNFKPNTRGEIKDIRWFNVNHLPTHKKDMTPKDEIGLMANNFFMIHTFIRPLRKWISEKKKTMCSMSGMLFQQASVNLYHQHNVKSLMKADEKIEYLNRQRKQREAEEYKKMHVLMNPLLSKRDDEDVLKNVLGMNVSSSSQPEAIRKLLSGTVNVSPRATPEKHSSKSNYPSLPSKGIVHYGEDHLRHNKKEQSRQSRVVESYAQKASRSSLKDSPSSRGQQSYFNAYTHQSPKNSPSSSSPRKLQYPNDGRHRNNSKTAPKCKPSSNPNEFNFNSSAFLNFRFNYDDILAALS